MFRDHRTAGQWFPKTMYITRFQESGYTPLAEYDEDIDVTTGTAPGVSLMGDSLSQWKEGILPYRNRGDDQRHGGVWLGWNNHIAGSDTTKLGKPASYTITISDSLRAARKPDNGSAIYLSLAATNDKPGARAVRRDTTIKPDTSKEGKAKAAASADSARKVAEAQRKAGPDSIPIEITVEMVDSAGHAARLPLSRFGTIRRPLDTKVYRRDGRDDQRFATTFELVPQTFVMPLADFAKVAPQFDAARLTTVRLLFDKTNAATVVVSDIGLSPKIDPAFLASPLP